MCIVSNYVRKGNISEEIVEVSSVFIQFLLKEEGSIDFIHKFIYSITWLYTKVIY